MTLNELTELEDLRKTLNVIESQMRSTLNIIQLLKKRVDEIYHDACLDFVEDEE